MRSRPRGRRALSLAFATLATFAWGCADAPPVKDLAELMIRDSTYYDPETMRPYSGPVFRAFPDDPTKEQIRGSLLDGTWHGELTVYHESGRVRYLGSFDRGERCGAWTENADDVEIESLYDQLRSEVETLGLYPPCPDDS